MSTIPWDEICMTITISYSCKMINIACYKMMFVITFFSREKFKQRSFIMSVGVVTYLVKLVLSNVTVKREKIL